MSAILSTDDLNDFISPGVACIKPVETLPSARPPPQDDKNSSLEHEVILDGQPGAAPAPGQPAEISLTDCLACSGCVTSAEAVLVSLQSHAELLSTLDAAPGLRVEADNNTRSGFRVDGLENPESKLFVASVSPQTRASLAAVAKGGSHGVVGEIDVGRMLAELLVGSEGLRAGGKWNNGFTWVADTNHAREACLVLGADEVTKSSGDVKKPILTSSCPGWVCYAEKTHPYVLPHMSRVKSPQALMGTLLKTVLGRLLEIPPSRIWHLAVMPCFDKKLEASREELTDAVWNGSEGGERGVRDVDCVITSKEVLMLTESREIDFFRIPKAPRTTAAQAPFPDPAIHQFLFPSSEGRTLPQVNPAAGTSGGNLHYILQHMAAQHPGSQIETVRGRNADVVEYTLRSDTGEALFKAARFYGFRNIQNLVRKLKPARPSRMPGGKPMVGGARRPAGKAGGGGMEFGYVEVMACPGGCTNGGGQVKVDDPIVVERLGFEGKPGPFEQKQWLAQVDEAYFSSDESDEERRSRPQPHQNGDGGKSRQEVVVGGISPSYIRDTLAHWASITGIDKDKLTLTTFREVVSDVGKDNKPTDTERVAQLAGKIGGGW